MYDKTGWLRKLHRNSFQIPVYHDINLLASYHRHILRKYNPAHDILHGSRDPSQGEVTFSSKIMFTISRGTFLTYKSKGNFLE